MAEASLNNIQMKVPSQNDTSLFDTGKSVPVSCSMKKLSGSDNDSMLVDDLNISSGREAFSDCRFTETLVVELKDSQRNENNLSRTIDQISLKNVIQGQKWEPLKDSDVTSLAILSLPIDSLHCVASFLSAQDWCNGFGLLCKASASLSREIIRRVRLHGFKCATEVVTAFKLGQVADAKELAALYVSSGVPLYAKCAGYSYTTLHWRIQVEQRQLQNGLQPSCQNSDDPNISNEIDPFYTRRAEYRSREGYWREMTYYEEKCRYYVEGDLESATLVAPNRRRFLDRAVQSNFRSNRSCNSSMLEVNDQHVLDLKSSIKIALPIHQHLLERHKSGHAGINDYDGRLIAPPVSLSADFFHPLTKNHKQNLFGKGKLRSLNNATKFSRYDAEMVSQYERGDSHGYTLSERREIGIFDNSSLDSNSLSHVRMGQFSDDHFIDAFASGSFSREDRHPLFSENREFEEVQYRDQPVISSSSNKLRIALNSVEPEVYSASLSTDCLVSSNVNHRLRNSIRSHREILNHLHSRFTTYQRRLECLLSQVGGRVSSLFEESLLDFWDEFFPHTADIHYHDTETAVPRISRLHKFLTKPCPEAIGVIQCEIERVRVSSRGKGVNVTGRLFPTYEYRLFIRNRIPGQESLSSMNDNVAQSFTRRDTVLMVAKNRGRKYTEESGAVTTSKKGSNNYHLYMPKQMDVDDHFNLVNCKESLSNDGKQLARLQPNGVSSDPVLISESSGSILLGRLQSNFVGTEFQIFIPRLRKVPHPYGTMNHVDHGSQRHLPCVEDDELDYDSGVSSDTNNNPNSLKRSRFGRLARRRNHQSPTPFSNFADVPPTTCSIRSDTSSPQSLDLPRSRSRGLIQRTLSSPDLINHGHQGRISRRAIANSSDAKKISSTTSYVCEEENGVITYTANLLGSRPRIMDVCIPKVTPDGSVGLEWKKFISSSIEYQTDNIDNNRMLSCFRQLQQRRENAGTHSPVITNRFVHETDGADNSEINSGVMENDGTLRSPDDFGLTVLQNRPPWWNVELGSFVLNFGGRVSVASVKNFQLCERSNQDKIMLQFGRIQGRHSFTMDYQHPLTAVQAFSIAISSLQSKISFG